MTIDPQFGVADRRAAGHQTDTSSPSPVGDAATAGAAASPTRRTPRRCPTRTAAADIGGQTGQDVPWRQPASASPLEFLAVMRRLRAECAWKREQTHSVAGALPARGDPRDARGDRRRRRSDHLREELGDLLLQVYFHAVDRRGARRRSPSTTSPAGSPRRCAAATRTSSAPEVEPLATGGDAERGQRRLAGDQGRREAGAHPVTDGLPPRRCPPCSTPTRCSTGWRAAADAARSGRPEQPLRASDVRASWASACWRSWPRPARRASTPSRRCATPYAVRSTTLSAPPGAVSQPPSRRPRGGSRTARRVSLPTRPSSGGPATGRRPGCGPGTAGDGIGSSAV